MALSINSCGGGSSFTATSEKHSFIVLNCSHGKSGRSYILFLLTVTNRPVEEVQTFLHRVTGQVYGQLIEAHKLRTV